MALLKALLCQLLAGIALWLASPWLKTLALNSLGLMLVQGTLASLFALTLRHARWWLPLHLLFPVAIGFSLTLTIPAWLYLLAFSVMLLVYWGTIVGDVPLFLSSPQVAKALAEIAHTHQAFNLIDLGAGIGSVVVPLARRLPSLQITAVENAPLPWLILRWRCRNLTNIQVVRTDFWNVGLEDFAIVFVFLSPTVMPKIGDKCQSELSHDSMLISSSFLIPGRPVETVIDLSDQAKTKLFVYRL